MELYEQYPLVKAMFASFPGVKGVGIGTKETGGDLTGRISWRVYVKEKLPLQEVPPEYRIPPRLFNIQTDVITIAPVSLNCGDNGYKATLVPGAEIANAPSDGGTLGCFARLKSDSSTVILSNYHVLYDSGMGANAVIGQPSVGCSSCNSCGPIANNVGDGSNGMGVTSTVQLEGVPFKVGNMDCGIAKLITNVRPYTNNIPGIGMITGTPPSGQLGVVTNASGDLSNPDPNSIVRKVGATSGLTTGQVVVLDTPDNAPIYDIDDPMRVAFIHQMLIMPRQSLSTVGSGVHFCKHGDSGSVVVNKDNKVIGLLRGKKKFTNEELAGFGLPPNLGNFGIVTPIQRILTQLNIEIPDNFKSTGASSGDIIALPQNRYDLISPGVTFGNLKRQLKTYRKGEEIATVIERHIPEISKLVNNCRPVTVTWHRSAGPAWSVHFINSLKDDNYLIPAEVKGISRHTLLTRMSAVLMEYGSEVLRNDLIRYNFMIAVMDDMTTIGSWLQQQRMER